MEFLPKKPNETRFGVGTQWTEVTEENFDRIGKRVESWCDDAGGEFTTHYGKRKGPNIEQHHCNLGDQVGEVNISEHGTAYIHLDGSDIERYEDGGGKVNARRELAFKGKVKELTFTRQSALGVRSEDGQVLRFNAKDYSR